jgi:hypothetical protein
MSGHSRLPRTLLFGRLIITQAGSELLLQPFRRMTAALGRSQFMV